MAKDKPTDQPLDMDALLSADPADEAPVEEPQETPEAKRIRELEETLNAPSPAHGVDAAELTPEQQRIRELEDRLARKVAAEREAAGPQYEEYVEDGEKILIHFLEDGFTFSGVMWYRGQECEFVVGSKAYEQQKDRNGNSWLDLRDDVEGQYARYGKQYFASGPWRGRPWGDTTGLTDPNEIAAARAVGDRERARNRAVPVL